MLTAFITLNCCLLSTAYHERNGCQLSFGSCPFLTADNWLCTCSKWVLSAKPPAQKIAVSNLSPNCEAAHHHWALRGDAFLVPQEKSAFSPATFWDLNSDLTPFQSPALEDSSDWPLLAHSVP